MSSIYPDRGDIIWLDFDPQAGSEIQKRRPALVVSESRFNQHTKLCVVCPITSTQSKTGFHVPLPLGLKTAGVVKTEQVKSLDYMSRNFKFIEIAPQSFTQRIRQIIATFI